MSVEYYIEKYGNEIGIEKYNIKNKLTAGSKEAFIKRHGEIKGELLFNQFREKCGKSSSKKKKNYENNLDNYKKLFNTNIEYWLEKTNNNREEAIKLLYERQSTSTLDKFIKKYGKEIGIEKYQQINKKKALTLENFIKLHGEIKGPEKYEMWINNLKKVNSTKYIINKHGIQYYEDLIKRKIVPFTKGYSNISIELFDLIFYKIKSNFNQIYYKDNEYMFFVNNEDFKIIKPDFYIKDINLIIEFYGDFWHKNPIIEKYNSSKYDVVREYDDKRINIIKNKFGCEIMIIWENEYKNNPKLIIDKIIKKIELYGK